jgi:hypothetical protein
MERLAPGRPAGLYLLVREHDAVRERILETTEQKEHHRDETA